MELGKGGPRKLKGHGRPVSLEQPERGPLRGQGTSTWRGRDTSPGRRPPHPPGTRENTEVSSSCAPGHNEAPDTTLHDRQERRRPQKLNRWAEKPGAASHPPPRLQRPLGSEPSGDGEVLIRTEEAVSRHTRLAGFITLSLHLRGVRFTTGKLHSKKRIKKVGDGHRETTAKQASCKNY